MKRQQAHFTVLFPCVGGGSGVTPKTCRQLLLGSASLIDLDCASRRIKFRVHIRLETKRRKEIVSPVALEIPWEIDRDSQLNLHTQKWRFSTESNERRSTVRLAAFCVLSSLVLLTLLIKRVEL
jgi:hypothetical protein